MDENTICLACPPSEILEDNKMDNINIDKETGEIFETRERKITEDEVLNQIDKLLNQMNYINDVIHCADYSDDTIKAMQNIVELRETTIQRIIDLLRQELQTIKSPYKNIVDAYPFTKMSSSDAFVLTVTEKIARGETVQPDVVEVLNTVISGIPFKGGNPNQNNPKYNMSFNDFNDYFEKLSNLGKNFK